MDEAVPKRETSRGMNSRFDFHALAIKYSLSAFFSSPPPLSRNSIAEKKEGREKGGEEGKKINRPQEIEFGPCKLTHRVSQLRAASGERRRRRRRCGKKRKTRSAKEMALSIGRVRASIEALVRFCI